MAAQPIYLDASAGAPPLSDLDARFNGIVARYGATLYGVALRELGDPDNARDALQDALLLAYRHLDQFEGRSQISTWLTRIVINAARGQRRRARSRPASSLEEIVAAGHQFADTRRGADARIALLERRACLRILIERLSPRLRDAIQVCDLEGLPMGQAALRLGIKASTLKCRTFRAHRRLASLYAEYAESAALVPSQAGIVRTMRA